MFVVFFGGIAPVAHRQSGMLHQWLPSDIGDREIIPVGTTVNNPYEFQTFGRSAIYTAQTVIDRTNVVDVLRNATSVFDRNASESKKLYDYYKGNQPILYREKQVRPEINNTIVVNRAYEIVTFKTGRFLYKDIQYINRRDNIDTDEVNVLNNFMHSEGKAGKDRVLTDWFHICGNGYRMIIDAKRSEGTPFHLYVLDPDRTLVVYTDTVEKEPVLGAYKTINADKETIWTAYTKTEVFTIKNWEIISQQSHMLGDVPIVEYQANNARLGAFEVVMSLLDAINLAQSNRLDGIEQFIQALMVFKAIDMSPESVQEMKQVGAICIPPDTDIEYLVNELNQEQTQTLVDDMYQAVLTICGMPNRNGGSSTSDNKGAVVLRDGWSAAATAVKETKQYFEASERRMLKMALKCFNTYMDAEEPEKDHNLSIADIDIHFDEGEYENTLEKAQVLTMLLGSDWVHPRQAYELSNIAPDPESAYNQGKAFHEEVERKEQEALDKEIEKSENEARKSLDNALKAGTTEDV